MARPTLAKWEGDAMQLSDLVRAYVLDPRYLTTAESKNHYDSVLRQYIAYLLAEGHPNTVRSFNADTVEGFVHYLFANGLASSTVNTRLSILSGLAKYGMQNKPKDKARYYLDENPVLRIKKPKVQPKPARYLLLDELKAMLAVEGPPNERLAVALLIDQPFRATEWCEATVKDLLLRDDAVVIQLRVKGGAYKEKVLSANPAQALLATLKEREAGPEATLLVNTEGSPYNRQTYSEMVARTARRAGITRFPVRAHAIRHSIASIADETGSSVHEIAEMLNHSNTATVRRYVHARPDAALARVREALNSA